MPNYTVELHRLFTHVPETNDDEYWSKVAEIVGLDQYPIFDEAYRARLNRDIVENFYFREVGHETVEMFRFAMRRKMRVQMEVFNDLFESQRTKFDPLATIDMRTMSTTKDVASANVVGSSTQESNQSSGSRSVDQSTPQVALRGNADYASGATDVNGKTKGESSGREESETRSQNDNDSESRTTGYQGSPAALMAAYRASLINVTTMLFAQLEELFMGVWSTDDDYVETEVNYLGY